MEQPLLFLIKLAWACRYRLPLLITVGFMALDIRMQLEIHVQMRRIRRGGPTLPLRGGRNEADRTTHDVGQNTEGLNNSDDSSNSWLTVDDDESDHDEHGEGETVASTSGQIDLVEQTDSYLSFPEISNIMLMHDNLLDVNVEN